jgi:hypothetical protein
VRHNNFARGRRLFQEIINREGGEALKEME